MIPPATAVPTARKLSPAAAPITELESATVPATAPMPPGRSNKLTTNAETAATNHATNGNKAERLLGPRNWAAALRDWKYEKELTIVAAAARPLISPARPD